MSKLAILGGHPVREKPFSHSVVVDESEWELIKSVFENKEFSRFMGSPSSDVEEQLIIESIKAEKYDRQYFTFLGGKMVRKFEAHFARKFAIPYAVSVNSATSGLCTALGSAGIGPGDEVITTSLSFNSTAMSILLFNSIPVFVDIDNESFCMDPEKVEKAVTAKTKAILVVHLLGKPANMDAIMEIAEKYKLVVIEDCAQAPGSKHKGKLAGTIGHMGVFSFQETKNIQTGEGGMLITKDPLLAKRARLIRNHGESVPDDTWDDVLLNNIIGMNYRMTELTAAMGIAQLAKLDKNNKVRKENALYLSENLNGLPGLTPPCHHPDTVPHIMAFLYDAKKTGVGREKILNALRAEGVPVGAGYLRTMYENPIFLKKMAYGREHCPWSCHIYKSKREYKHGDCPVAENLLREKFIWVYHIHRPNGIEEMKDIVQAFKKIFSNLETLATASIDTELGYKW